MTKQDKRMVLITGVLFIILVLKSLFFDPIKPQQGEAALFQEYALEVAPAVHQPLIFREPLVVYRMVALKHDAQGEDTIIYTHQGEAIEEVALSGSYTGKIRVYLLGILPYQEITIKGGTEEWKQN